MELTNPRRVTTVIRDGPWGIGLTRNIRFWIFSCAFLALSMPARAYNKVSSPEVVEGRFELEVRSGWDYDDTAKKDGQRLDKFVANYGITSRWMMEAKLDMAGNRSNFKAATLEWSNRYQLLKDGEGWLRLAVQENYKHALQPGVADVIEVAALTSKDTGAFRHTGNFYLANQVGGNAQGGTDFNFGWNSRYRYNASFQPGVEIYGDLGTVRNLNETNGPDKFQVGPVVQGKVGEIKYDLGYLFGMNEHVPDGRIKAILTAEF